MKNTPRKAYLANCTKRLAIRATTLRALELHRAIESADSAPLAKVENSGTKAVAGTAILLAWIALIIQCVEKDSTQSVTPKAMATNAVRAR